MSILVGVIAGESARHSLFSACMTRLDTEGMEYDLEWVIDSDWCRARNQLAQMALEGEYSHLWFMDDDHAFHPQMLRQLTMHDVPLVQPICCTRTVPFQLVTYVGTEGDGYLPLSLGGQEGAGLVELAAGGCAGMLIRRDVLEAVPAPWFEYGHVSEDINFCEKVREAGFSLYADLSCRLGHITTAVVYPEINEGQWMTLLNIGRMNVFVDAATMEEEEVLLPEVEAPPFAEEPLVEPEVLEALDEIAAAWAEEPQSTNESLVKNPCLICGKEAVAHDASGVWCCAEHHGDHEVWKTYYERIEIWYVEADGRWYGRAINMAGQVVETKLTGASWTQEEGILRALDESFSGVSVFHITDELQDSRKERRFGPSRLWTREPS